MPSQQEDKSAAKPVPINPWAGALGPKIQPELVNKSWKHDRDPTPRRATFGVFYPLREVAIEKSDDLKTKLPLRSEKTKRRSIPGVRFHLRAPNQILSDMDFQECKFHIPDEHGKSTIASSKFENCTFKRCFLGGTLFRHVRFDGCTFSRCDLGDSQFEECQFLDCKFTECTAENSSFRATEVDPTAFLGGMQPPIYNYESPVPDGETATQVAADWVEVRRKLAAQLLRSNTEIHHTSYSDRGLFELKRAEVSARLEALRAQPLKEGWLRLPLRVIQVLGARVILTITKGGTSLSRLFVVAMITLLIYTFSLSYSHATFMNHDCHLSSFEPSLVLQQFARATSLFLAIGYTSFSGGGSLATTLLTAAASFGLFWYALVAAVVIRRVYR